MKKNRISLTVLAFALAMCVLFCTACGEPAKNTAVDTVTIISYQQNESFDISAPVVPEKVTMHAVYDCIVAFGPDGEIIPALAESWTENEDGTEITFKIKEGIKFHDGTVLTAEDIAFSMDTILAEPTFYFMMEYISSYEVLDEYTIKFVKAYPFVDLYNILAELSFVVPKAAYSADKASFTDSPIGTGPFKVVSRGVDGTITFERFDDYSGTKAPFKTLIVKGPIDASTALIALETGEADMVVSLPMQQSNMVLENEELSLIMCDEAWAANTILMMGDTLATDKNLRNAIDFGINRESAIKLANEGAGFVCTNIFSRRLMGKYEGLVSAYSYDVEKAKECLAKSNYQGQEIMFSLMSNQPLAESIQADMKEIGINIAIESLDANSYYEKLMNGELEMTNIEYGTDLMTLVDGIGCLVSTYPYYGENLEKNERFDELVALAYQERDRDVLIELVKEALEIARDMSNLIPLYESTPTIAYRNTISYQYPISATNNIVYSNLITLG